jgi:hypothetical protein
MKQQLTQRLATGTNTVLNVNRTVFGRKSYEAVGA